MMRWYRSLTTLALAFVLVAGLSCTSDTTAPMEPSLEPSQLLVQTADPVLINLLPCTPLPYAVVTKAIGKKGGVIKFGVHSLVIPKDVLLTPVTITAEQIPGAYNTVRFQPEGLRFSRPATLTLNYKNCPKVTEQKKIVYTDELLEIIELLPSRDIFKEWNVSTPLDHFSRYAVAY